MELARRTDVARPPARPRPRSTRTQRRPTPVRGVTAPAPTRGVGDRPSGSEVRRPAGPSLPRSSAARGCSPPRTRSLGSGAPSARRRAGVTRSGGKLRTWRSDSEAVPDAPPSVRAFPRPRRRGLPPPDPDLRLAWQVTSAGVVLACCILVLWVLQPSPAAAQHDAQRRRSRCPRLVPRVPPGPSAPALARRRLVERLVRRLPRRAVLLPVPGADHRARSTWCCRTTSR